MFQAKANYDFQAEPNTAEMSITAGETLKITRTDVGDGWWEGTNSQGKTGLFPETYVEKLSSNPPSWAPPVPPPMQQNYNPQVNEDYDADWDDDTYSEIEPNEYPSAEQPQSDPVYANNDFVHDPNIDNKGTVTSRTLNRFGSFARNGGEGYLTGNPKVVPDNSKIYIYKLDENTFSWPNEQVYAVQVTSPKKESKLGGFKKFIAYQLTPVSTGIQVSRRYKHFDWLHERLCEKFSLLAVPPLPDKQISGRYEEQFIEHRRCQLQEFVNYVTRHPVLSKCEVWQHFLTCTDEKRWKIGKRTAEKDELIGANFAYCIEAPEKTLLPSVYENLETNKFKFINNLDSAIKEMLAVCLDQSKKFKSLYSREYHKVGTSLISLGTAIEFDSKAVPCKLSKIIKHIGHAYYDIGTMHENQPTKDYDRLGDKLYLYKGLTSSFQGIFATCKGAQNKRKELEKTLSGAQLTDVKTRSDVFIYTTLAELSHFKNERDSDLKESMREHLEEQIVFYSSIVDKLKGALANFD